MSAPGAVSRAAQKLSLAELFAPRLRQPGAVGLKIAAVNRPETAPLLIAEPAHTTDILLVDDSLTDLRLLMDMLMARRVRVSVAFDGTSGYQQAVLQQPKLILLDVHMPTLDGYATCRLLKANPRTQGIPVIFLTAASDLKERLQGFALGGVDYIGKPFNEAEVMARIGVHWQPAPASVPLAPAPEADAAATLANADAVLTQAAQKVLRQSLAHPPSLDDLASLIGTNRRKLNHAFGQTCAMPVFAWLREERLRQAKYLVAHTDTPLAMASDYLGFSSPAHFAKAFRERFGCTPRELRGQTQMQHPAEAADAQA
jgi:DNA-binding response OmpR family regulator